MKWPSRSSRHVPRNCDQAIRCARVHKPMLAALCRGMLNVARRYWRSVTMRMRLVLGVGGRPTHAVCVCAHCVPWVYACWCPFWAFPCGGPMNSHCRWIKAVASFQQNLWGRGGVDPTGDRSCPPWNHSPTLMRKHLFQICISHHSNEGMV